MANTASSRCCALASSDAHQEHADLRVLEDGDERRALGRIQLQHRLHQVDQLHAVFARRHLAERLVSVSCVRKYNMSAAEPGAGCEAVHIRCQAAEAGQGNRAAHRLVAAGDNRVPERTHALALERHPEHMNARCIMLIQQVTLTAPLDELQTHLRLISWPEGVESRSRTCRS